MSRLQQKPILHGRDHSPGGVDPIPGIGGIAFDTYPQAGQWLYVETDGPATSPSGFGMEFFDDGGNGIDLNSPPGGHLALNAFGSGDSQLTSGGTMTVSGSPLTLNGGNDGVNISAHDHVDVYATSVFGVDPLLHLRSGRYITMEAGNTKINFDPSGTFDWLLSANTPTVHLNNITSSEVFRIEDGSGNSLLEVRGDGTFHILTGASWVADL